MAVETAPREAGDDTDRPCPRDDFRRIVTPLYPAEDRHETPKPNSQNILLFRSDFIHFSFPASPQRKPQSPYIFTSPNYVPQSAAPKIMATTWKNESRGNAAPPHPL